MYLIGYKGVKVAINREASLNRIMDQLAEFDNLHLQMVEDYIRGLKAANRFLSRT